MNRMLNADPALTVKRDTHAAPWQGAETPGLSLLPLDAFAEGRATMLARLDAGVSWAPGACEVLVLEGELSDGTRPYGPGGYFLAPGHLEALAPSRLYVKVHRHLDLSLALDTGDTDWVPGLTPGLSHKPLYHQRGAAEAAAIVRWAPGTRVGDHNHPGGEEVLVLEGVFSDEDGDYPAGIWYRSADGSRHTPFTREGCVILVRTGGLPGSAAPPDPAGAEELAGDQRRYAFDRPFPCDFEALARRVAALALPGWRGLALTVEELYLLFDRDCPALAPEIRRTLARMVASEANLS